jgi:hypothetical protein
MINEHAATDLRLYIDNDGDLYQTTTTDILRNLATKVARGEYRHDLAVKLFGSLVKAGAKKYVRAYGGGSWHQLFSVPTRRAVAEGLTRYFETENALGAYTDLLPKKYGGVRRKSAKQLDEEITKALATPSRRRR